MIVQSRTDLLPHNIPYAHSAGHLYLMDSINLVKSQILIGATGVAGTFTKEVIQNMAYHNEQRVKIALSKPTNKSECTAEQVYSWSRGKAIFASGSPFDPIKYGDNILIPGQSNDVYIFPGIGLGSVICNPSIISDEFFLIAEKTLANMVTEEQIGNRMLFPPLTQIQHISFSIALAIAERAFNVGIARSPQPDHVEDVILAYMFNPDY